MKKWTLIIKIEIYIVTFIIVARGERRGGRM
jgi:hypothetical protein